MSKGILKRQESLETTTTPDSASKHVKWDEEKLLETEGIKMTIPKGQIDEPKTPFQHGIYGSSCDESGDDVFKLRSETEGEESITGQSENEATSCSWESSMSEFETDADLESPADAVKHEKFKTMRAQHYFMRQSLQRGKDLIETDEEE